MVYLNPGERRVIARLVANAYNKTYDRPNMNEATMRAVLFSVRMVQHLLRDPRGKKERAFYPLEKFVYHHPFLSGLFINDNCYSIGKDEWEKMNILFQIGRGEYKEMLDALGEVVESTLQLEAVLSSERDEEISVLQEARVRYEKALKLFASTLGSRSYHTGMPV